MKTLFRIYVNNLEENQTIPVEFGFPDEKKKLVQNYYLDYKKFVVAKQQI